MSCTLNEELAGRWMQNIMVGWLTNPPLNIHSHWNLRSSGANSSGMHAAKSSPYIVKDSKALLYQGRKAMSIHSAYGWDTVVILYIYEQMIECVVLTSVSPHFAQVHTEPESNQSIVCPQELVQNLCSCLIIMRGVTLKSLWLLM